MCYGGCDCQRCNPEDEPVVEKSAWTTERPKMAGFYWFREPNVTPYVVQVGTDGLGVWVWWNMQWELIETWTGEWQPVAEPEA